MVVNVQLVRFHISTIERTKVGNMHLTQMAMIIHYIWIYHTRTHSAARLHQLHQVAHRQLRLESSAERKAQLHQAVAELRSALCHHISSSIAGSGRHNAFQGQVSMRFFPSSISQCKAEESRSLSQSRCLTLFQQCL